MMRRWWRFRCALHDQLWRWPNLAKHLPLCISDPHMLSVDELARLHWEQSPFRTAHGIRVTPSMFDKVVIENNRTHDGTLDQP